MALSELLGLERNPSFGFQKSLTFSSEEESALKYDESCKTRLALPPLDRFALNSLYDANMGPDRKISINFDKGTTTLAFRYKGGVVVCADSRATGGNYIGSQSVKKIIEINPYLLGTMAGGAADCVYWERILSERCRIYELRNRERISVAAASKLLANILYNYKG